VSFKVLQYCSITRALEDVEGTVSNVFDA